MLDLMNVKNRIKFHIYLAYSNYYLAKSERLAGYEMLYRLYMGVAKEHLLSAKKYRIIMFDMEK